MRKIFIFKTITSTNDLLIKWSEDHAIKSGTIIWALEQTKGRGQHGKTWKNDAEKNLAFSILIKHNSLHISNQFLFNKAVSLALVTTLHEYSDKFKIKWPNDIYINKKKIAGILIENTIKGMYIKSSVIGIGVNVNQNYFPNSLPHAGSLKSVLKIDLDIKKLMLKIANNIDYFIQKLNSGSNIEKQYLKHLYRKDVISVFERNNTLFNGIIKDVDKNGMLKIEIEDEKMMLYKNGDIKLKL